MSFLSRLRFLFGILIVVAIVGGLILYLVNSMSTAHSSKAELAADASSVGTDYAGLVVAQKVDIGDKVKKGQVLFEVQSSQLVDALENRTVTQSSLSFSIDPTTKNILLKANNDGVIDKINYRLGSYAPAGGIIATINTVDSVYVIGYFRLSPPDYARVSKDSKITVTLPDNSTRTATIFNISLVRNGNNVDTVVKARLKGADLNDIRFSVGTPVQSELQLTQETWYDNIMRYITQLFKPGGQ